MNFFPKGITTSTKRCSSKRYSRASWKKTYDERKSLRDKIIDEVKKIVTGFGINIAESSAEFTEKLIELKFYLMNTMVRKIINFYPKNKREKSMQLQKSSVKMTTCKIFKQSIKQDVTGGYNIHCGYKR